MVGAAARPTGRPGRRRRQGRRHHARRLGGQRWRRGMSPPHTGRGPPTQAGARPRRSGRLRGAGTWARPSQSARSPPPARTATARPPRAHGRGLLGPCLPALRPPLRPRVAAGPCGRSGRRCPRAQRPQQMGAQRLAHSRGGAGGGRGGGGSTRAVRGGASPPTRSAALPTNGSGELQLTKKPLGQWESGAGPRAAGVR